MNKLKVDTSKIPQIDISELNLVLVKDYWDGPVEGLCKWKDELFYFIWTGQMDQANDEIVRNFVLLKLTQEEIAEEERIEKSFQLAQEKEQLNDFFENLSQIQPKFISEDRVVGWFEGQLKK